VRAARSTRRSRGRRARRRRNRRPPRPCSSSWCARAPPRHARGAPQHPCVRLCDAARCGPVRCAGHLVNKHMRCAAGAVCVRKAAVLSGRAPGRTWHCAAALSAGACTAGGAGRAGAAGGRGRRAPGGRRGGRGRAAGGRGGGGRAPAARGHRRGRGAPGPALRRCGSVCRGGGR